MSALDRVLAARAQELDLARRETFVVDDRGVVLKMRPASFSEDRAVIDKLGDARDDIEKQLSLCAIHLGKYVEGVYGIGDGGELEPFYGASGANAYLDEALAIALEVEWVSSARTLRALVGDANLEQLFGQHSEWSVPSGEGKPRVRRLGESPTH